MTGRKVGPPQTSHAHKIYRLAEGAELVVSEAETTLLVVRGACTVRSKAGKLERVEAGTVVLRQSQSPALDHAISRTLGLMQAEPSKRWTVQRLARSVGLSRAAFARRFAAVSGRPPLRYLTDLRLALAASLLETQAASLAEIAARVGYASEFAFSRAFRRRHGVPPGVFRRMRAPFSPLLRAA